MRNILPNNQMRALGVAMASAVVAAVATMFVPVRILEGLTGSIGISEIIDAAKAPLGDTARALIAFAAGAFTLAILTYILMRQEKPVPAEVPDISDDETPSYWRTLLAKVEMPKMPWVKDEDDITELADLPKLKNGDAHPDAPARRPLTSMDLPTLDEAEVAEVEAEPEVPVEAVSEAFESAPAIEPVQPIKAVQATPTPVADFQPSLAEMVAQLEAAVAERAKQLAELEMVAAQLGAGSAGASRAATAVEAMDDIEILPAEKPGFESASAQRPSSAAPSGDEGMDSALSAALATLHRMNDGTR